MRPVSLPAPLLPAPPPSLLAVSRGSQAGPTIGEQAREINRFLRRAGRFRGIAKRTGAGATRAAGDNTARSWSDGVPDSVSLFGPVATLQTPPSTALSAALALSLPVDRRQSPTALGVQRGVRRLFAELGHVTIPEFTLANGRRADLIALGGCGKLTIIEIKSSVADFRADRKWPDYREFCDRFYFAVPETLPVEILPDDTGLIVADAFGAAILREPPAHPLAAARRKAVTLRFAHAAAGLLHALADPGSIRDGAL